MRIKYIYGCKIADNFKNQWIKNLIGQINQTLNNTCDTKNGAVKHGVHIPT